MLLRGLCEISLNCIFLCSIFKEDDVFFGGGSPTDAMTCSGSNRNLDDKLSIHHTKSSIKSE